MKLTVIGCSGSVSGPDSPASCYLLQADGFSLVLDLGPGSFGALLAAVDPAEVGAFGFSHLHPDHCSDFCSLHVAARSSPTACWSRRPVFGPAGTKARLQRLYEVDAEAPEDGWDQWDFRSWEPTQTIGPFEVSTAPAAHPVETVAIRVATARRTLTFTGDTGPSTAVTDLARGSDVLLSEAAFVEPGVPDVHLTGEQAGEMARDAGVGRLLITHVPPWHSPAVAVGQARRVFQGPVDAVHAGMVVQV